MLSEFESIQIDEDRYTFLHRYTSSPLKYLIQTVWRRLWVVVLAAVLSTGGVVAISLMQTPIYEASVEILVGQHSADPVPEDPFNLQQLTQTMVEIIHSRRVTERVIQELDLSTSPETLLQNMRAEQVNATQVIQVEYTDPNPQRAQEVADAIGKVFSEQVTEANPSASSITATVWEHAAVPERPVSPQPIRNGAIALGVGVMLGIALALLLDHLEEK